MDNIENKGNVIGSWRNKQYITYKECKNLEDFEILYSNNKQARDPKMIIEDTEIKEEWEHLLKIGNNKHFLEKYGILKIQYSISKDKYTRKKEPKGQPLKEVKKDKNILLRLNNTQLEKLKDYQAKTGKSIAKIFSDLIDNLY